MMKRRHASAALLDGVVDLERLRSGSSDSIERDAARFLELTYPTEDVKVYRHGGLTLMEMFTPWLVLGPVGSV